MVMYFQFNLVLLQRVAEMLPWACLAGSDRSPRQLPRAARLFLPWLLLIAHHYPLWGPRSSTPPHGAHSRVQERPGSLDHQYQSPFYDHHHHHLCKLQYHHHHRPILFEFSTKNQSLLSTLIIHVLLITLITVSYCLILVTVQSLQKIKA